MPFAWLIFPAATHARDIDLAKAGISPRWWEKSVFGMELDTAFPTCRLKKRGRGERGASEGGCFRSLSDDGAFSFFRPSRV